MKWLIQTGMQDTKDVAGIAVMSIEGGVCALRP
jgi:hypothetical protein